MESRDGWWRTFFQGVAIDFWSKFVPDEWTKAEADFIQSTLGLPAGARVLDVPCGDGRHSLELAARGWRPTGIDLAPANIERAKARAGERGLSASFAQGDMQQLAFREEFDGAFCLGNSFAYFDDAGNVAFLEGVARAVKPGGKFVLNTGLTAESLLPKLQEQFWVNIPEGYFLASRRYDPARGRLDVDYHFICNGVADVRPASYRVYMAREVIDLVERAGFGEVALFGGVKGEPFALGSPQLMLVARRK